MMPPPAPQATSQPVEITTDIEPDLEDPEVLLEPDEIPNQAAAVSQAAKQGDGLDIVNILEEDDTFSPPEPGSIPMSYPETPPLAQSLGGDGPARSIRRTLEATGDLRPQAAETFMVPSDNLEEAEDLEAMPSLDSVDLDGFDAADDDSLDLGGDDNLDLGGSLDDLDDE
jgi:hypothetical protein